MSRIRTQWVVACLLTVLLSPLCLRGQNVSDKFIAMPDSIVPFFSDSTLRVSLIEEGVIANPFGGKVVIEEQTTDRLRIRLDSSTHIELGLLPYHKDQLVCLIATSDLVPAQSYVLFYDSSWGGVSAESSFFSLPTVDHFLTDPTRREFKTALVERGHLNWTAEFRGDEVPELLLRVTSFDDQTAATLHPELPKSLREVSMRWDGEKFITTED